MTDDIKFLLIGIDVLLSGCGGVTSQAVHEAIAICQPYGGLKALYPKFSVASSAYEATCADGKTITGVAKP